MACSSVVHIDCKLLYLCQVRTSRGKREGWDEELKQELFPFSFHTIALYRAFLVSFVECHFTKIVESSLFSVNILWDNSDNFQSIWLWILWLSSDFIYFKYFRRVALFYIFHLKTTTKLTTTNITYCAVRDVGRHKVIKPPPRTSLTIFINVHSCFYRNRIHRTLSLKRALGSVKRKIAIGYSFTEKSILIL